MEHWHETYTSDVETYEALAAACDPEGPVWHRVLETIRLADKTVLEIGCGLGHYAQAIAPTSTSYTALDISKTMLAAARQRGTGIANLTFFPSLPGTKANVTEVREYLEDRMAAVRAAQDQGLADNSPEMIEAVRTELEPAYGSWGMFAEWLPLNIEGLLRIWAETGATGATPAP